MKFSPLTEEQLINAELGVKEGIVNFLVKHASHEISKKSGNKMIKLQLIVTDDNGTQTMIWDYLLDSSPFMLRKLKHFCESCGLDNSYQSGLLKAMDCINKRGKCEVELETVPDGTSSEYKRKYKINDYLKNDHLKSDSNDEWPNLEKHEF